MSDREPVKWWFSALCMTPWLVVAGPYMEACVVRLVLSRWPRPMFDDPKNLATAPFHSVLVLLLLLSVGGIPVMMFLALWNWNKPLSDRRYAWRVGVFAAGLIALWIFAGHDAVWDWFLD